MATEHEARAGDATPPSTAQPGLAPHNLPLPLPPLLGRGRELAAATTRLRAPGTRLQTLIGVGGVGKTRLALAAAAAALDHFPDGAWLVPLAPLQDPALVTGTVAQILGVREAGGNSLAQQLVAQLRDRRLLLVLDNCEHLLAACAGLVGALLAGCPLLRVLATSRAPLRLPEEQRLAVPPLALPTGDTAGIDAVAAAPAVALFVARAQAVEPAFSLDAGNAAAVAAICRRLDGLPLAIELAAARLKGRTPAALLDELGERLEALSRGGRQREARQRTLHALLDWSYTLLGPGEQALFARLSAFAGGWTAEAATAICVLDDDLPFAIAEGLARLAEQSLAQGPDAAGRYTMLETVREYAGYALARLAAAEDEQRVRQQHAAHFLALAEEAAPRLTGAEQAIWLARLEAEHDNLRAALAWAREHRADETGLRLATALWRFWYVRGHLSEGRGWLEGFLAHVTSSDEQAQAAARARALRAAAALAESQADHPRAATLAEESLALWRSLGDTRGMAEALNTLGNVATRRGDVARATALYEESLARWRDLGDRAGLASTLNNSATLARKQGDYALAVARAEESLSLRRELGDRGGIATVLHNLATVAREQGDYGQAQALSAESLALWRDLEDRWGTASALYNLAAVAREQGDYRRARSLYIDSLALSRNAGDRAGVAACLEGLAAVACAVSGGNEGVARLCGAAAALREAIGAPLSTAERVAHDRTVALARTALGERAFAAASAEGRAMPLEEAMDLAGRDPALPAPGAGTGPDLRMGVTGHRRLPYAADMAAQVERAVQELRGIAASAGYPTPRFSVLSPLAEGADRLVAEVILRQPGAHLDAILPLPIDEYREDFAPDASAPAFDRLLALARQVTVSPPMPSREAAYAHAGLQVLARCDVLIALWDGLPARGTGGTAEIVAAARARGLPLIWIHTEPPFLIRAERMDALIGHLAEYEAGAAL